MLSCFSCVWLSGTPWTLAYQAPFSMGFSRQEYWSWLPFPSPGVLPNPGIKLASPALQVDSLMLSHYGSPLDALLFAVKFITNWHTWSREEIGLIQWKVLGNWKIWLWIAVLWFIWINYLLNFSGLCLHRYKMGLIKLLSWWQTYFADKGLY